MAIHVGLLLCALAASGLAGAALAEEQGGMEALLGAPEPTDDECRDMFLTGVCNQTLSQELASAGSPLLRPLPFFQSLQLLASKDMTLLTAWSTAKEMGNYALCVDDPSAHHCTIKVLGGPSLGTCLPRECSADMYLQRFACAARLVDESFNATSALFPALKNATAELRALTQALDYLTVKSTSFCAAQRRPPLTKGATAMVVVIAVLAFLAFGSALGNFLTGGALQRAPALAWLRHFDAVGNTRRLLAVRAPSELDFMSGIRCLSTGYVVLGHLFLVSAFSASNFAPAVLDFGASFQSMAIAFAFYAVDAFFWMSGFFAAWSLLRQAGSYPGTWSARGAGVQSLVALAHRYARLTPVYAFVLLAYMHLLPYAGSGPLWQGDAEGQSASAFGDAEVCASKWWTNLLYVNNVVGGERKGTSGCMGWSWYLANDMQFFAVSAMVVPWFPRAPRTVVGFFCAAVAGSAVVAGAISHARGADITTIDGPHSQYIYGNPFCRCGAYAVGVLQGIWWHLETRRRAEREAGPASGAGRPPAKAWRPAAVALYLLSAAALAVLYALPWSNFAPGGLLDMAHRNWPQPAKDLFNALSRPLFAAALGGVAHCMLAGGGGIVRELLSAKVWEVLGKLSYGAYLWHLVLIIVLFSSVVDYRAFSRVDLIVDYLAVCLGALVLSYLSFLLVEKPFMNLEGALMARLLGQGGEARRKRRGPTIGDGQLQEPLMDPTAAPADAEAGEGSDTSHQSTAAAERFNGQPSRNGLEHS